MATEVGIMNGHDQDTVSCLELLQFMYKYSTTANKEIYSASS